jgi:hypothetical protein
MQRWCARDQRQETNNPPEGGFPDAGRWCIAQLLLAIGR